MAVLAIILIAIGSLIAGIWLGYAAGVAVEREVLARKLILEDIAPRRHRALHPGGLR